MTDPTQNQNQSPPQAPAPQQGQVTQSPPAAPSAQPQSQATPPSKPQAATTSAKVLLLVEDDPLLINMYQSKFSSEGFQVFTATDGEAGLTLAKSEKPDIIILDIMMPKLDGIEVLRRLRQDPNFQNIPVLMLSNLSEASKQREAMQLGAKEFLVKANLTPTQVVDKIKTHLGMT